MRPNNNELRDDLFRALTRPALAAADDLLRASEADDVDGMREARRELRRVERGLVLRLGIDLPDGPAMPQ